MKSKLVSLFLIFLCTVTGVSAQQSSPVNTTQANAVQQDSTAVEERVVNPWQQAKGELLLSPYLSYYKATSFRSTDGTKADFSNDGKFSNYNPRVYFSLPLNSDKLNLFGSVPYFANTYEDATAKNTNGDFGDIELGLRFNLANFSDNYLMGAVIGYIPAYSNTKTPFAGYDLFGLEPRLILAGTLKFLGDYNNFHKVELGLRYFFPDDPVQFRFLVSEGYRITNDLIILGELEGMFSFSDDNEFFQENLQLVAEFQFIKASASLGYEFTDNFALYGGLFQDVFNRNSAIGSGFQTFAVIKIN